jgi:hypothetical protein
MTGLYKYELPIGKFHEINGYIMSGIFARLIEGIIALLIGFSVYFFFESLLYEKLMAGNMSGLEFTALSICLIVIFVSPIAFFIKKVQDKGY